MTALNKQALRERYSSQPVPKCHICGAEMTVQRISASRITYGCTGATYNDAGCHYAEGRSIADYHYEQSRVIVVDVSDPDVLALLDELEATEKQNDELRLKSCLLENADRDISALRLRIAELEHAQSLHVEDAYMLCGQFDELAAAMGWTSEIAVAQGVSQLEYARNFKAQIAELSASHSKLRDTMATIHNTIRMDGGYTPLATILNAAKRAHEESATAAGIGVKGE